MGLIVGFAKCFIQICSCFYCQAANLLEVTSGFVIMKSVMCKICRCHIHTYPLSRLARSPVTQDKKKIIFDSIPLNSVQAQKEATRRANATTHSVSAHGNSALGPFSLCWLNPLLEKKAGFDPLQDLSLSLLQICCQMTGLAFVDCGCPRSF